MTVAHQLDPRSGKPATRRALLLLLALAALVALAVSRRSPVSVAMPEYLADAQQWASTPGERMTDTFTPLAYPLFIAPALHYAGPRAVIALQAALYLATVAVAFGIITLLGLSPRVAALGSLPILLFPEFFDSITKIWDVGLSAFLFLLLTLLCLLVQRTGPNTPRAILLGLAFGAGLFCRPNFALIAPVILYAIASSRPRPNQIRTLYTLAFVVVTSLTTYAALGTAAHGSPFLPYNGPYNLYVGNNPMSAEFLLHRLNGEPSLYPNMRATHPELTPSDAGPDFFHQSSLQTLYTRESVNFILRNPGQEVRLVAIKLLTFFRPDTKIHPLASKSGIGKAILALPALFFAFALLPIRRPGLGRADWLLLAIDLAYILPFLLTNSDPRFRAPLDALLLLHLVRLIALRAGSGSPASSTPAHAERTPLPPPAGSTPQTSTSAPTQASVTAT